MKTIGLIGGMSWESSANYYRTINQLVKQRLGGFHSAKIVMVSVDFAEIEALQQTGEWDKTGVILANAAITLEQAGTDVIVLCTNTMHIVADQIAASISIPFLHIADATAEVLKIDGIKMVGLLGTAFTMQQDFYKGRLQEQHGINVVVPREQDQTIVHNIIYQELVQGVVTDESREKYIRIINQLHQQGCQGVILGCTEIAMLVQQDHTSVPLYDTTQIHAEQVVSFSFS